MIRKNEKVKNNDKISVLLLNQLNESNHRDEIKDKTLSFSFLQEILRFNFFSLIVVVMLLLMMMMMMMIIILIEEKKKEKQRKFTNETMEVAR